VNKTIKMLFADFAFYKWCRSWWCAYLRERPRRRLRKHGASAMKIVHDALNRTSAQYYADYGTLLGIKREHDFIRHDDDIDYSVIAGSMSPAELYGVLNEARDLTFSHAFEFCGLITEMTFLYHGIEIDFFFVYKKGDATFAPFYDPPSGSYGRDFGCQWLATGIERSAVSEIQWVEFKGTRVPIPANADTILRENYGNWKVPVKGWSNATDYGQKKWLKFDARSTVVDGRRILEIGKCADSEIAL